VVEEGIDWPCELLTNYADTNLGLKQRISSGLDWAFEITEQAIILEDDCLPHSSFFRFCEELLDRYRDDTRIMAISGDNLQFGRLRTKHSYYFSRFFHCWGWASWRRAWQHYDPSMALWPAVRDGDWLWDLLGDPDSVAYWSDIFDAVYKGAIESWAYRNLFAHWVQNGLNVLPTANLVSNIGFGVDATHTRGPSRLANIPVHAMTFPLQHPPFVIRDTQADDYVQREFYTKQKSAGIARRCWAMVWQRLLRMIAIQEVGQGRST
jgi:hypothetical protein